MQRRPQRTSSVEHRRRSRQHGPCVHLRTALCQCLGQACEQLRHAGFGAGMLTALVRIAGRPFALLANNPQHLGGAIDPEAADRALTREALVWHGRYSTIMVAAAFESWVRTWEARLKSAP